MSNLIKVADDGMEPAGLSDPRTGLPINVSIATRKKYRAYWSGQEMGSGSYSRMDWSSLRNKELNEIIGQDFARSHGGFIHLFKSNRSTENVTEWIEIRLVSSGGGMKLPFNLFLAAIRRQSIDIITVTTGYKKPKKPRLSPSG